MEALSTRKLVLETGKFNVITAHSTKEAMELFDSFPNISGAVLVKGDDIQVNWIATTIRNVSSNLPIIVLDPHLSAHAPCADHTLSSYEPQELLTVLRDLFGDPRKLESKAS